MGATGSEHRRTVRVLWVAFVGIALLATGAGAFDLVERDQADADAHALVRKAERSTYLLLQIGQRLARVRANLLEAQTKPVQSWPAIRARIDAINRELDSNLGELPAYLSPDELREWRRFEPKVRSLRRSFAAAGAELGREHSEVAELLLDDAAERVVGVFEQLERIVQLNNAETRQLTQRVSNRLRRGKRVEAATLTALVVVVGLIGLLVVRFIRRQQTLLDGYVRRIEHSNQDLESFAGRVAHDIKNVLTPVQLTVSILRRSEGKPEAIPAIATRLDRTAKRAVALLDGLLAFARAGAEPERDARADVRHEVHVALEQLAPIADSIDATVDVRVPEGLEVRCSPALLGVVLLNLTSNALKFLAARDERVLEIGARAEGEDVCIAVRDTGPGIAKDSIHRIFEPFYRAPGVAAAGVGIGLATVQRVVTLYGGRMEVHSELGEGTTFYVWLERAPERRDQTGMTTGGDLALG